MIIVCNTANTFTAICDKNYYVSCAANVVCVITSSISYDSKTTDKYLPLGLQLLH